MLPSHVLPDLDAPVSAAGDEDVRGEAVEVDAVHGHVMRAVRMQVETRVRCAALVDFTLLRTHQEYQLILGVERDSSATTCNNTT